MYTYMYNSERGRERIYISGKQFCKTLAIKTRQGDWNQYGGVEGCALTPSCENTRITTSCWTLIDRKTLELTKKDTPHPKTKKKPQ